MAQLIHGTTIANHIAIHAGNMADHNIATTSYVTTQINNLIDGAPGALDTLNELAAALGDNANFATGVTDSIAGKVSKAGDSMSGSLTMGAGAAYVGTHGDWTGEQNKIQWHSNHLYLQNIAGGNFFFRRADGTNLFNLDNNGSLIISGDFYPNGQGSYRLYVANSGLWTNGNFGAEGDIYLGTRGVWLSSWLNQSVQTGANVRFSQLGLGAAADTQLSVAGSGHISDYLYLGGTAGTVNSWGTRTGGFSGYWRNNSRDVTFNNEGYGTTWTFAINTEGAVTINRHIDANTGWGAASGNTIFVGWYGGKVLLGNNSDGGHDFANAIAQQSIVSTNKHFFYKGAYLKNNVDGAEVLAVDGINGRLFTVTDSLVDSIYSVNTIAGLPVFEVFANSTVVIGKYGLSTTFSNDGSITTPGSLTTGGTITTPSHGNSSQWNTAYNKRPTAISFSGGSTKTLTLTHGDGSTLTAAFNDIDTDTNTDGQTLSISGSTLTISGGNSISLPSGGISQATADGLYQPLENQRLSTGDGPTFANVYTNAWFRNNNANEGLYNQATATHLYSSNGSGWTITGSGGIVELVFRSNHQNTIRGYVYADTSNNIGFLNNSGNWAFRTDSSSNAQVYGYLTVGNGTSSDIYMTDTDETTRRIHCNSGRIGFLTSANNWGAYADNSGNWFAANLSGTNTGDQTDIAGNAATATNVAWTGVTGRPTALSQFSNDLGNYGGFLTSYTETDTLASVTARGASTSTAISLSGNLTMSGAGSSTSIIFGDSSKRINVEGYWMMFKGHENEGFRWQTAGQDAVTYTTRMQLTSSALTVNGTLSATNFSGSSSGTNTGDQTNISGNAASSNVAYDLQAADSTLIKFNRVTNNDYSTMSFMSRAWQDVQGVNGLAYNFTTHTNNGGGGYGALQIYYGEGGHVFAPTSFRAPIFYDSGDTGYYLDPNDTSNLWRFTEGTLNRHSLNSRQVNSPWSTRASQGVLYQTGAMGWGGQDLNVIGSNWGSGFFDTWGSPANGPGESSHYVGIQAMHYSNSDSARFHGWQMACAQEANNRWFWRSAWDSPRAWVEMIHSGNIGSQSVSYATSAGSATSSSYLTGGDSAFYGLLYNSLAGDLNTYNSPGLYSAEYIGSTNRPFGQGGHFIQISDAGGTDVKTQWYYGSAGADIAMRLMWGNGGWKAWRTLVHDGNISSQSVSYASSAGNADTVDGYHASTSTIANGIVVREGNGYILGNYINMSDNSVGSGVTGVIVKQGDNYYRTGTAGAIQSFLGLGSLAYSSATIPTNLNQLTNGPGFITQSSAAPRAYVTDSFVDFVVDGDADKYYPVVIQPWNGGYGFQRYSIHRGYSWQAPWDPIGTGSHKGGLTLTFDWSGDTAWGGNDKTIRVIQFGESYTTMVAGLQLDHCAGVVVWLRGGSAQYRLHGPGGVNQGYSINLSGFTGCAGVNYPVRSYDSGTVTSEIYNRYPVRSNTDLFYNNNAVIHAGNIGSQSVNYASSSGSTGNADTVDGFHAAVAGTANTIPTRNASGYLIPENWIQLNGIYGLYSPTNNAHLRPNDGSYGSWLVTGSRNGWRGLEFDSGSNGNVSLMVNVSSNSSGFHNNSYGWQVEWANGTLYCSKNAYGGGTQAVVLDAVNYTGYAPTLTGAGASGTWGINVSGVAARATRANGNFYIDDNYGNTVVGVYESTRLQGVWAMGDAYKLSADGTSAANHYGIAWSHPNHGGEAANLSDHGMLIQIAGRTKTAISTSIWCIGDIIAFSDARVKANVAVIDNPLERLSKVRGVTFTRTDLEDPTKRYTGVIAQEMREALPEAVSENSNGELSVSYGNTVSLLIESIKAQQAQIEELKLEVKKLKGE